MDGQTDGIARTINIALWMHCMPMRYKMQLTYRQIHERRQTVRDEIKT